VLLFLQVVSSSLAYGQYQFRVLHAFGSGHDGAGVWDTVAFDTHGSLYGTTSGGGARSQGTVFRLMPRSDGQWAETIMHNFPSFNHDGGAPVGGVLVAAQGSIYGMAPGGGTHGRGLVFKLIPSQARWSEKVLYNFCSRPACKDGETGCTAPTSGSVPPENQRLKSEV